MDGLRNRLEKKYTSLQHLAYDTRHARTTDAQKPCMPTYREKESYTTPSPAPSDAGNGGSFVVVSGLKVGYMRMFDAYGQCTVPPRGRDCGFPWDGCYFERCSGWLRRMGFLISCSGLCRISIAPGVGGRLPGRASQPDSTFTTSSVFGEQAAILREPSPFSALKYCPLGFAVLSPWYFPLALEPARTSNPPPTTGRSPLSGSRSRQVTVRFARV